MAVTRPICCSVKTEPNWPMRPSRMPNSDDRDAEPRALELDAGELVLLLPGDEQRDQRDQVGVAVLLALAPRRAACASRPRRRRTSRPTAATARASQMAGERCESPGSRRGQGLGFLVRTLASFLPGAPSSAPVGRRRILTRVEPAIGDRLSQSAVTEFLTVRPREDCDRPVRLPRNVCQIRVLRVRTSRWHHSCLASGGKRSRIRTR